MFRQVQLCVASSLLLKWKDQSIVFRGNTAAIYISANWTSFDLSEDGEGSF